MLQRIGEILIKDRLIDRDQLNHCLEYQKTNRKDRLGSILKHLGFISDQDLARYVSKQIGWKFFKDQYIPDYKVIDQIGLKYFTENQIFPLRNGSNPSFIVSYVDNLESTDYLKLTFGSSLTNFYIGSEIEIRNALDLIVLDKTRHKLLSEIENYKAEGIESLANWFERILNLAILTRSTDIHIEPSGKTTDVRFRIDGLLVPITCLRKDFILTLANIILSKCDGDPCSFGIQDGRFDHEYKELDRVVDIRFSQIPTIHGPSIVLRLLDKARASIPLESLGYSDFNHNLIDQAIVVPYGITLVTGPTGSGKSTTLGAILNKKRDITRKIVTIEDPVEITHPLMQQVAVDLKRGLSFEVAVRSFLRHDPNTILIGEIRDKVTAEIAFLAANTGLQIFSTLHTNDPISAILRLKDLGVDSANISASLVSVISQRLVRKLCPLCKESTHLHKENLEPYKRKYLSEEVQKVYKAVGCEHCRHGYMGRTVVAEVLLIDEEIKEMIGRNAIGEIYGLLRQRGTYRSMVDDMKGLIQQGDTSIDEAVRVLG